MRKKLLLLLTIGALLFSAAKAQYVTLTDTAFRSFMKGKYPTCFNAAGQLDTTCSTILSLTTLTLADTTMPQYASVTNLHGLQYFKGLTELKIHHLAIKTLAQLPDQIKNLEVDYNDSLSTLTNFPAKMIYLSAEYNALTSLPPFPGANTQGYWGPCLIGHNKLTSLPALPNPTFLNLGILRCNYNNLTSLPFDSGTIIQNLYADHNQLTSISYLPGLDIADVSYNHLTSLPVLASGGGSLLKCNNNQITNLDLFIYPYMQIDCQNNQLSSISRFPDRYQYPTILNCSNNPLISLPEIPYWITELHIQNTQLALLSLQSDPQPSMLGILETYNNNLTCLPSQHGYSSLKIDSLQFPCVPVACTVVYSSVSGLPMPNYPICNPTNSQYSCNAAPLIQGKVFYDLNSNGVKDAAEFYAQYTRLNLSDGSYTYTDQTGLFQLSANQLYTPLTLSPVVPSLYKAVPADSILYFWTSDTTVIWNIPLQPIVTKDSVNVVITTNSTYLRPNTQTDFYVSWKNAGTTNLGPTDIVLHFNSAKLTFNYCSSTTAVQTGSQLTLHLPSLSAGSSGFYYAIFTGKTTLQYGDTALTDVVITSGSVSSVDTAYNIIKASFDPNDKQATETISPLQISNGGYINYTIRFQNTGNDTAVNIVIADTLSAKLKANTLELVSTSHNCKVIAHDNLVYFEMKRIMLPDSNVNEQASHGFIKFRIKPMSTLALGDAVNNKASIYFDYNKPVVTNTAVTQIALEIFPLKMLTFTATSRSSSLSAGDGRGEAVLQWATANEINVDHFIVERSYNGREFAKIGTVKATGAANYSYIDNNPTTTPNAKPQTIFYRLKMLDKDGQFTYSPIRQININHSTLNITLYPNPAKDNLQIEINSDKKASLQLQVLSMDGKVILSNSISAVEGSILRSVNISSLQKGTYLLKVSSADKEESVVRFEKL